MGKAIRKSQKISPLKQLALTGARKTAMRYIAFVFKSGNVPDWIVTAVDAAIFF